MNDVEPRLKPKAECGCGCGVYGTLRSRPWRDGVVCVSRGCDCRRCMGKRSRTKGDSKARRARKALAITGVNSRHEELLGGAVRVEFKAGKIVAPACTAFFRCEQQSEQARPIGDTRPFVACWMPDGSRDGVVAFRLSQATEVAAALLENLGAA